MPYNPIVDQNTLASVDIDHNHHEIHEGDHYFVAEYITLANVAVGDYVFAIGSKPVHFVFSLSSDVAGFSFETYKGVESTNGTGTLITPINNNGESEKISTGVLRYNPSGVVIGTAQKLRSSKIGVGGNPSSRVGGSLTRADEVILAKNTKYLLRITNLSTGDNDINIGMTWYEHESE